MSLTPAKIDQLKRTLVGWSFSLETPVTVEAADQIIRTQVHPELYAAVQHLNTLLENGGPAFIRRVADSTGYTDVLSVFPHAYPFIDAYRKEEGDDQEMLAQAFREFTCLAAFFHDVLLHRLFAAIYALRTAEQLHRHAEQMTTQKIPVHQLAREHAELQQRITEHERHASRDTATSAVASAQPKMMMDIMPAVMTAYSSTEAIPHTWHGRIGVTDAIRKEYHIDIDEPQARDEFHVEKDLTIPWDRVDASGGIVLQVHVNGLHVPERMHVSVDDLLALNQRGSALPMTIGRKGDIRLYPEYVPETLWQGSEHPFPDHTLVSIRAAKHTVEIRKHDSRIGLTVFV